jgi:purine-nucleoside phosphorylase
MPCNPKQNASADFPVQQLLREIATQLGLHHKKIANHIVYIQKVVIETLLLDTPSSAVDVEALELEAETAIEGSAAIMATYEADIDKLPVPVLVNLLMGSCGSVGTLIEVQHLATVLVGKEAKQHESYIMVFKILKEVCEEGKKVGWVKFRDHMVAKYGVEKLKERFI